MDTVLSVGNERPLDEDDPRPLWEQLAARLRARITSGDLHGKLPAEWRLAADYHVSRDTTRRALEQLREDGLVTSTRGRGTFTVPGAERPAE